MGVEGEGGKAEKNCKEKIKRQQIKKEDKSER